MSKPHQDKTHIYGNILRCIHRKCRMVPQTLQNAFRMGRHEMETFAALLALCAGNSPVTDEFPTQRPVTRSFDVFFVQRLNKRLSKHSSGWWFETPSRSLWRHCNVSVADTAYQCEYIRWFIFKTIAKLQNNPHTTLLKTLCYFLLYDDIHMRQVNEKYCMLYKVFQNAQLKYCIFCPVWQPWLSKIWRQFWHPNSCGSLQWRQNECDGVSNHQPRDCLFNCLFSRR